MEVGIDSFASHLLQNGGTPLSGQEAMRLLLERIERADQVKLDVFGIGEHHRAEFLDSAPAVILAAAAARTKQIRLTSAVTVLSAAARSLSRILSSDWSSKTTTRFSRKNLIFSSRSARTRMSIGPASTARR